MNIHLLLILAGVGQICLVIGSTRIPKILGWRSELDKVNPFLKHIFWVYAIYILLTNFSFGLLSALAPETLTDSSKLASIVTGFICIYWLSRFLIQFFYFERANFPKGNVYKIGEIILVLLFASLTAVYGYTFYLNTFR
jgi:hypothetical protein